MTDLISKDDAMGAVQDHFNADGFKGYDDGQKMMDRIKALPSAEDKNCWNCKHYEPKYDVCHAPELVKQVTSKLNNPCDSLLTDDSVECKEQKSKLEHDREWIIGCIKHDGFIKTDRFDKANQIILDALSADAVQGEWVYGTDPITGEKDCIAWTCSLCGGKYQWQPNYCPNCGARMKGGAE